LKKSEIRNQELEAEVDELTVAAAAALQGGQVK